MLAFAVVLTSVCLHDAAPAGVDNGALKQLQGVWQLTTQEHGGKRSEMKDIVNLTLEVKEAKFVVRDRTDVKEDAKLEKLEAKGKPATLDLVITAGPDLDKVLKGIWKFDGNALTICVAEPGKDRPKEFAGKEGTGHTLFVFRKAKK